LTVHTFTSFIALHTCSVTLAIVFVAVWFFACAFSGRYQRWYSFKVSRFPKIGNLLCTVDVLVISCEILAANANASSVACPTLRKAFAVKFKTVYLCALASRMLICLFSHFWVMVMTMMMRMGGMFIIFVKQLLEEILGVFCLFLVLLDFYESGRRRGCMLFLYYFFPHVKKPMIMSHSLNWSDLNSIPDQKLKYTHMELFYENLSNNTFLYKIRKSIMFNGQLIYLAI